MSDESASAAPILTRQQIDDWVTEYNDLQRQLAEARQGIEAINQKLAAAELVCPGATNWDIRRLEAEAQKKKGGRK